MQAAGKFIASVGIVLWLAVLGCASVPSAAQAGSTNLNDHGGSPTAGNDFTLDCGNDFVLVGVRARRGWWVDRIAGLCMRLRDGNRWVGGLTVTGNAGDTGGTEVQVVCPRDTAVRALRGRFGSYVNRLILRCRPLVSGVAAATIRVQGEQAGDHAWDYEFCPNSKFARGFHGRAGSYIDRAGLICHSGTTPGLQAAPSDLVAVNVVDLQSNQTTTAPTPFVQAQWTDRSTAETGFRVSVASLSSTLRRSFVAPAAAGINSRLGLVISDLPSGQYGLNVCAQFGGGTNPPELCPPGQRVFTIAAGRGEPAVSSVVRIGAGTARVSWTHNFDNPSRFDVNAQCGNSPLGFVASTQDGTARQETFNIGVGPGQVQVCAQYTSPAATSCSALFAFQCN